MQRYAMPEKAGFEVRDLESLRERLSTSGC